MRIVCISDTHALHERLDIPPGDVLVHAGDLSRRGSEADIRAFDAWLGRLPHAEKVVIAGNHDFAFERDPRAPGWITHAHYLQDSGVTIQGVRFWGSPWQPRFFDWAFNLDRGADLRAKWRLVPTGVDVLVTHGPPMGILDRTHDGSEVGCEELAAELIRIRPRLHVFGHIHEAYGRKTVGGTTYVNASSCTLGYQPVQAAIIVDL